MLKIGKTPFRNTEFIYYWFWKDVFIDNKFEFYTGYPSEIGEMVAKGELDIAPASSIIYAKHSDEILIIPDISISSSGKTNSILVFSETISSIDDLSGKAIALPFTSASSIALIEIILKMKKIDAKFIYNQRPDIKEMLKNADAGLLIGDHALASFSDKNTVLADLGEEWYKLTGESMVYALWLVNKKSAYEKHDEIEEFSLYLHQAKEYAYKNIDLISKELALASIDSKFLKKHLLYLSYNLNEKEKRGLLEYFRLAKKFNIINKIPELEFFE